MARSLQPIGNHPATIGGSTGSCCGLHAAAAAAADTCHVLTLARSRHRDGNPIACLY